MMEQTVRLGSNVIVNCDESIGRKHNFVRMCARRRQGFANRVQGGQLAEGKIDIKPFGDVRRARFEFESRFSQQIASTGRI